MKRDDWLTIENATEFIHHSNAIENIHHSKDFIRGVIEKGQGVPEVYNHFDVLYKVDKNAYRLPNIQDIKNLHKVLMKDLLIQGESGRNGQFRDYDVQVGVYRCPSYDRIDELMNSLVSDSINLENKSWKKGIKVERAWYIHDRFERIHPFGDGNGRVGRLLLNWIRNYYCLPILIVNYEDRFKYYKNIHSEEH